MNETSPGVVVTGLVTRFGDVVALDGIELRAERGTVLGLLGPNGAGKTTTVRVLSTLLLPDEGSVRVGGHDVVHDPAAVRQLLGLTGQFAAVDDELTGTENLVLFGRLRGLSKADARQRAEELLESFDLVDAAAQRVGTYSGGMRRRLDLAVSLVTEPEVLVLDEPTTGLDPRSRMALWDQVRSLRDRGITILLTTQYLEEADVLADRIVVIDQGRVVAEGTPGELKQRIGGVAVHVTITDPDRLGEVEAILAAEGLQVNVHPESSAASAAAASPSRSGWDLLAAVGESLAAAGIEIEDLGLRRPSLDEVFLALTGSEAES
jgi:daunorubicin resistance ABC transporter ATP-binding subunit